MVTQKQIQSLYEAFDIASKEAAKVKNTGPLGSEWYDGRQRAFELAKKFMGTWLEYYPEPVEEEGDLDNIKPMERIAS